MSYTRYNYAADNNYFTELFNNQIETAQNDFKDRMADIAIMSDDEIAEVICS